MSLDSGRLIDADVPAELRQERIAGLVQDRGFVRAVDLATRFQVSTVTIRSDLQVLEARGKLHRIRGGAVPASVVPEEQSFEAAELDLATEKAHIGEHAARMVASGETVLLDVGTTTTAVARALVARTELSDVTVFTTGLNVALELESAYPRITVVVTGGTVRPMQHSLVNPLGGAARRLNARLRSSGATASTRRAALPTSTCPRPRSSGDDARRAPGSSSPTRSSARWSWPRCATWGR